MEVLHSLRDGFPSLKTESKAACKTEFPGARRKGQAEKPLLCTVWSNVEQSPAWPLFCSSLASLMLGEVCDLHRLGKGPGMVSSTQQVGSGGGPQPPPDHPLSPSPSVGMPEQVGLKT